MWRFGSSRVRLPAIIGHEIIGRLEAAPPAIAHLRGSRVVTTIDVPCFECPPCRQGNYSLCDLGRSIGWEVQGGFAELLAIPGGIVETGGIVPVPDGLADDEAVLAEPVACALRGQEVLNIGPADTVLVIGAGPMGYLHACLSRLRGARQVILCDLLPRRLEQTLDAPVDVRLVVDDRFEETVRDLTKERGGPDAVVVAAATAEAQMMAVRLAAKRGRVNFYASLPAGEAGRFDINPIHSRELRVVATRNATAPSMQAALRLLATRRLPVGPLRQMIEPFEALATLFERFDRAEVLKPIARMAA
jgi:L-iditol 2-dehydrogenase